MTDIVTHASAGAVVGGAISAAMGAIFHVTPDVIFAAFIGSWIGAALLESISFKRTALAVLFGTFAVSYLVQIAFVILPDYSHVSLAFAFGFITVYFHKVVLDLLLDLIKRQFGKIGG